MDLNKPFRRYSFYLDLQNSPQVLNQLTQYINALGGVFTFISFLIIFNLIQFLFHYLFVFFSENRRIFKQKCQIYCDKSSQKCLASKRVSH
jgi:hypothetical protein